MSVTALRAQPGVTVPSAPSHTPGGWLLEAALVLALSVIGAVVTTWPLVLDLGSLAHNVADTPFQAWTIDWVQHGLTTEAPLWDANIFTPNRNTLAYSDSLLGIAVPMLPLRALGVGPLAQLNLALLLGIATSAATGYLFGRVVVGTRTAGALVAVAFGFGTFGTASLAQLHGTLHGGIALGATAAWWLADRSAAGRSVRGPVVLLVAATVWQLSVSFYPGAYAVLAVLVVLAVRRRDLGRRGAVAGLGGLAVCGAAAVALGLPYIEVLSEGRSFVQEAGEVANLGVDLIATERRLVLWGPTLASDGFEMAVFPGVVLLGLGLVGLVAGARTGGESRRVLVLALTLVAVGLFFGLGTSDEGWRAWSPYRLLFEYVPGFTILRGAARAWVIGLLGLGLLAGVGATTLAQGLARRGGRSAGAALVAVLVVGGVAEGYAPWDDRPTLEIRAVDRALATRSESGGVLYLPAVLPEGTAVQQLSTAFSQATNVYGTTEHHRATPNGYAGLPPEEWPERSERLQALPSPATLEELADLRVRFVVVQPSVVGTPWERLLDEAAAAPLELIGRYGRDLLYRVPGSGTS